jgi:protein-L-isoaspartate(D-aspartate) O-methyltransferase
LQNGGKLIIPVGGRGFQQLEVWTKEDDEYSSRTITAVAFVPLRGTQGWDRKKWRKN